MKKPICDLSDVDGNVFAVIGHVSKTLTRAGQKDKATEFRTKATQAESYDHVLAMINDYVEITFGEEDEEDEEGEDY